MFRAVIIATAMSTMTLVTGCDVFDTREPEPPDGGVGTWLQPDTPDRVVQNIQNSISEMNSRNYLRSLAPDFVFEPTVSAMAREPSLWTGWAVPDEETYFGRLVASSNFLSGHSLQLLDITDRVRGEIQGSGLADGVVTLFTPSSTSAVTT